MKGKDFLLSNGFPRVVIVGAGHAGGACVLALRRGGFEGSITLVGQEVELPYERPALSKTVLMGRGAGPVYLASPEFWSQHTDLRVGLAVKELNLAAREVFLSDGTKLAFDTLVLATGGKARSLIACGPSLLTLRSLADARDLALRAEVARSAIIIGGGVIGLEVASSLASRGLTVDVVEAGPQLMGRNVPEAAAAWIAKLHDIHDVGIHLGESVASINRIGNCEQVALTNGKSLLGDLVVAGIGIEPQTELAVAAGLACRNGVLVDASYRSISHPEIYAIGDVAAKVDDSEPAPVRQETWAHAGASARVAARAILGQAAEPEEIPWFWTEQFGHILRVAGAPATADTVMNRGSHFQLYVRNERLVGVACLDAPRDFSVARRLIADRSRLSSARLIDETTDLRKAVA